MTEELEGTQFTCFTSTKVQILTPEELEGSSKVVIFAMAVRGSKEGAVCAMEELSRQVLLSLLALLVQKYKY
jgi:hypothetical protein